MSARILVGGLLASAVLLFVLGRGLVPRGGGSLAAPPPATVGRPAPDFALERSGGEAPPLRLADLRGFPAVINFWATWCEGCREEHALLQKAAAASSGHVRFVGVALDGDATLVRRFLEANGSAYPVVLDPDGRTASAWGAVGVPTTFFLDEGGVVRGRVEGPLSAEALAEKLRPLLTATKPSR